MKEQVENGDCFFVCVQKKEQRGAEIADMCSFIPSSLEHCNAMRILGV